MTRIAVSRRKRAAGSAAGWRIILSTTPRSGASTEDMGSLGRGKDAMDESNWHKATQAVTDAAESEIRSRTDDCNEREPDLPAPTMSRCNLPKGHKGPHSFQLLKEK